MARNQRSSGVSTFFMVLVVTAIAMVGGFWIKEVQDKNERERLEAAEREFQADLAANYEIVTATILQKETIEYDTGTWEHDDEGELVWENCHVTKYDYVIEYEFEGEMVQRDFTSYDNFPEEGHTMEIYIDNRFGQFHGTYKYVKSIS